MGRGEGEWSLGKGKERVSARKGWGHTDIFIQSPSQQVRKREWKTGEAHKGVDNSWRLLLATPCKHGNFSSLCPYSSPVNPSPSLHSPSLTQPAQICSPPWGKASTLPSLMLTFPPRSAPAALSWNEGWDGEGRQDRRPEKPHTPQFLSRTGPCG